MGNGGEVGGRAGLLGTLNEVVSVGWEEGRALFGSGEGCPDRGVVESCCEGGCGFGAARNSRSQVAPVLAHHIRRLS